MGQFILRFRKQDQPIGDDLPRRCPVDSPESEPAERCCAGSQRGPETPTDSQLGDTLGAKNNCGTKATACCGN